jgi:ABC-2 type transport system permease protein
MNKIWIVIKREYLTRVRNKTFILSTFLTPLVFAGILATVIFVTIKGSDKEVIGVIDHTGLFKNKLDSTKSVKFVVDPTVDTSNYEKKGYTAILYSPNTGINTENKWRVFSKKNFGIMANDEVNRKVRKEYENRQLEEKYNISVQRMDSIRKDSENLTGEPAIIEKEGGKLGVGNSEIAYAVGYAAAFLIYITLFIYGAMVMRGVMEEKTNRIAEVVISSLRPFQLMMGKIVGIGAVGLTQFFLWIILIGLFSTVINSFLSADTLHQVAQNSNQMPGSQMQSNQALSMLAETKQSLSSVNWFLVIGCFIFYFIFGYLFYAALFAAVGSAVNEDPQDAQSLMLPITMPLVLAIIIMMNAIIHPEGSMAIWSSIIPFFSPVVMMARIPFGVPGTVPWWQLTLSMTLLIAGFLFTTWLSGKIYRTAILMYGKKAGWKEMWKWAFRA